jgi:hypothetical protein
VTLQRSGPRLVRKPRLNTQCLSADRQFTEGAMQGRSLKIRRVFAELRQALGGDVPAGELLQLAAKLVDATQPQDERDYGYVAGPRQTFDELPLDKPIDVVPAPAADFPYTRARRVRRTPAKQKFREWDAEVTARIEAIRAERKGEGVTLTRQQARALAGEWYHWFITRHPTSDSAYWEAIRDQVHSALREAVGDAEDHAN